MMSDIWRYALPVARLRENLSAQVFYSDFDTADYARRADLNFDKERAVDKQKAKLNKIKQGLLELGPEGGVYSDGMDCFGVTGEKGLSILEAVLHKATFNVYRAILPDVLDPHKVDAHLNKIINDTPIQELDRSLSMFLINQRSKPDPELLKTDSLVSADTLTETPFVRSKRAKELFDIKSIEEIQAIEATKAINELLTVRKDIDGQEIISHLSNQHVEHSTSLKKSTEEIEEKVGDTKNFSSWAKSRYEQACRDRLINEVREFFLFLQTKQPEFYKKIAVRVAEKPAEDKLSKLNDILREDLNSMLSSIPETIDENKVLKTLINKMESYYNDLKIIDACKNESDLSASVTKAIREASDVTGRFATKLYFSNLREGISNDSKSSKAGRRVTLAEIKKLPQEAIAIIGQDRTQALWESKILTAMTTGPRVWAAFRGEMVPPPQSRDRDTLKHDLFGSDREKIKATSDGSWM
ncbi:hypothetical protein GCM10009425_48500 [Pseudomonas asuensis]|uniref:Uncharacterized protein n=2 Tax=Pseudomonas asuensis TaxID=1825787 RepID=A0ABQ2H535_9PSED|nr:hypothetical protein GCM10009425_48500 [Pseudomonas asuensis]